MLNCDVLNKQNNKINFDDLSIGETFVIDTDGCEWIGMKVLVIVKETKIKLNNK